MSIQAISQECADLLKMDDSCCRRRFLIKVETTLSELWEENNYGQVKHDELRQIRLYFFGAMGDIKFTSNRVWFCGTVGDEVDHRAENSLPYLSSCLILLASTSDSNSRFEEHFGELLKLIRSLFNDKFQLINALMENDERLFIVLVSLMRLSSRMELPDLLDPLSLSLLLLCEVDFSETVFVDWLCSESVASIFSLQFFKLLQTKLELVPGIFETINQLMQSAKPTEGTVEFNSPKQVVATFEIRELHGDELVSRTYPIYNRVGSSTSQPSTAPNKTFASSDLVGFVSRLHTKLTALNNKQLMPFNVNPLLRVIKNVDDLM